MTHRVGVKARCEAGGTGMMKARSAGKEKNVVKKVTGKSNGALAPSDSNV